MNLMQSIDLPFLVVIVFHFEPISPTAYERCTLFNRILLLALHADVPHNNGNETWNLRDIQVFKVTAWFVRLVIKSSKKRKHMAHRHWTIDLVGHTNSNYKAMAVISCAVIRWAKIHFAKFSILLNFSKIDRRFRRSSRFSCFEALTLTSFRHTNSCDTKIRTDVDRFAVKMRWECLLICWFFFFLSWNETIRVVGKPEHSNMCSFIPLAMKPQRHAVILASVQSLHSLYSLHSLTHVRFEIVFCWNTCQRPLFLFWNFTHSIAFVYFICSKLFFVLSETTEKLNYLWRVAKYSGYMR